MKGRLTNEKGKMKAEDERKQQLDQRKMLEEVARKQEFKHTQWNGKVEKHQ